ncbi:SMP-30/gluconolactonase/LRE family protein [Eisenibacter elegans]|uniref:SMP-30/gluconolactonase/LRE family protein n=1 Tax=Eisenibacter elegans TaxID=997 RepID=UPI000408ECA9|nr:SMP-30/gluconolactonase/LRE family protein [Eisenibacter elegans]
MRYFKWFLLALSALGLLYLLAAPVNITPVVWKPDTAPALSEAPYQPHTDLAALTTIELDGVGPEDIDFAPDGLLYTGLEDGRIMAIDPQTGKSKIVAKTKGRPLGLRFDAKGQLYIADAYKGLLRLDPSSGQLNLLTNTADSLPFKFTDDLDIARDGTVYFSDASYKFAYHDKVAYPLESGLHGRLLSYHPKLGMAKVLLDELGFANGVTLSPDEDYLLVTETLRYRVRKYWLKGDKKGQSEIWLDNLPGFPDGILYDGQGLYWIALYNPRNAILDRILPSPMLRKVVYRLPTFLQPKVTNTALAIAVDAQGKVKHTLYDTSGKYGNLTNIVRRGDTLYFGSLHERSIGVLSLSALK